MAVNQSRELARWLWILVAIAIAATLVITLLDHPDGLERESVRPPAERAFEGAAADLTPARSVEREGTVTRRVQVGQATPLEPPSVAPSTAQPPQVRSTEGLRIVQVQTPDGVPLPNLPMTSSGPWWHQATPTDEFGRVALAAHPKTINVQLPLAAHLNYPIDELPVVDGIRRLVLERVGAVRLRCLDLDGAEIKAPTEVKIRPQSDPSMVESVRFEPGQLVYLSRAVGRLDILVAGHGEASAKSNRASIDRSLRPERHWERIGFPGTALQPVDIAVASGIRHFAFTGRLLNGAAGRGPFTWEKAQPGAEDKPIQVEVTLTADGRSAASKYPVDRDGQFDVSFFVRANQAQDLSFTFTFEDEEGIAEFTYHAALGGALGTERHELGELPPSLLALTPANKTR